MSILKELEKQLEEATGYELPRTEGIEEKVLKCEPAHGMRVGWYFKEEISFYKKQGLDPRKASEFTGILILRPDAEYRSTGPQEVQDLVLIIDGYPCETCYVEIFYVSFAHFLDSPDLAEVFEIVK